MIKRKRTLFILLFVVALLCMSILYIWKQRPVFVGDRTKTSDCYILQFEEMNRTDSHVLTLEKNDVLSVEYSIEKGKLDFKISEDNEKPIYQGNDITDGKFEVIVPKSGVYQITVNAKHASGNISITANSEAGKSGKNF